MVTYTKILIKDVTTFRDFTSCKIDKTQSGYNNISTATINLDNERGCNKDVFSIGEDVKIYVESGTNPPTTLVFRGVVDDINFKGREQNETITVKCIDYTTYLKDNTVQPVVYTDDEISVIVKNIIDNELPQITTTNVQTTSVTLQRIPFNQINVFDALQQLAELADYVFYVDEDLDLHFEPKNSVSSGYTLDNSNIVTLNTRLTRKQIINKLWVYGDKILTNVVEPVTFDGGSVYTLDYKPHNTSVNVTGTTYQGGVYQMQTTPVSGQQYLVNFEDKQIIMTSGTDAGDNIPASGTTGSFSYDRNNTIVRYGERADSIGSFGPMETVIVDKNIKDPNTATKFVNNKLDLYSNPLAQITVFVEGSFSITPGNTINVDMSYHNINNVTYDILKASYNLTQKTMMSDQVLTLTLNKKIPNILDTMKDIILAQKRGEAGDIGDAEVYTRLQNAEMPFNFFMNEWSITTKSIGSRFYVGSPASANGWVGSPGSYYVTSGALPETIIASGVI